ncbi:MAG TPA: hypothetical protein VF476_19440 [Chitinophagaceae bacterium]
MQQFPFPTEGLKEDEIELFNDIHTQLRSFCDARFVEGLTIGFDARNFECLGGYDNFSLYQVIQLSDNAYLTIVDVSYSSNTGKSMRHHVNEFEAWGIAVLQNDFGHAFIKQEGLKEKLLDLFRSVELDIPEDHRFSKEFYVLAKDKEKAIRSLTPAFRETLLNAGLKDFALEIHQNILLVGNNTYLRVEDAESFAKFVLAVSALR